jgi:hypothetical protein
MDPDPGGPKTSRSYGSGSPTLVKTNIFQGNTTYIRVGAGSRAVIRICGSAEPKEMFKTPQDCTHLPAKVHSYQITSLPDGVVLAQWWNPEIFTHIAIALQYLVNN